MVNVVETVAPLAHNAQCSVTTTGVAALKIISILCQQYN